MVRAGAVSIAAGVAALTTGFTVCAWMLGGSDSASDGVRAGNNLSIFGTIHPKLISYGSPALQTERLQTERPQGMQLASLASFEERFSFPQANPPTRSLQPTLSFEDRFRSTSFEDRFTGTISARITTTRSMTADIDDGAPRVAAPQIAAAAPAPRAARTAAVAPAAPKRSAGQYQLASLSETPLPPAYASVDSGTKNSAINDLILKKLAPRDPAPQEASTQDAAPSDAPAGPDTSHTAIYDITAHVVYMPDGRRLEAHSGLGEHLDDPHSINLKSRGPTPQIGRAHV